MLHGCFDLRNKGNNNTICYKGLKDRVALTNM